MVLALALAGVSAGCSAREPDPAFATARADDPPLTESWQLPPGSSPLRSGDLGSTPVALSTALMAEHAAAGVSHRIATRCTRAGALANVASLALRFSVDDGALVSVEGDPPGPAAECTTAALREEVTPLLPLPAGAALMVLRFEPAPQGAPKTDHREPAP